MRAAVLDGAEGTPRLGQADDPEGGAVGAVVAAAVNPIDKVVARGAIAFRHLTSGAVLGLDGVARTAEGLRYVFAPRVPFGTFAELVPLDGAETAPVPDGLDPVVAAALGVPGIAAWLAVAEAAQVGEGDAVLVLGATGAVGRLAVQVAAARGASTVVGTARDETGMATVDRLGARPVSIADLDAADAQLTALAPAGFDVVVDMLWGAPMAVAARHLARGARVAQVGNSAGPTSSIDAPSFRNKGAVLVGHSNFLVSAEERMTAYRRVAELAAAGNLQVSASPVPLDDFDRVWAGNGPTTPVFTL